MSRERQPAHLAEVLLHLFREILTMRPLIVLHSDPTLAAAARRLTSASSSVFVSDWAGLRAAMRDAAPNVVAVVDPFVASETGPAKELRSFLEEFGYVPVIGAFATRERPRELIQLARWGLADVISLDLERPDEALRQRLLEADQWALRRLLQTSHPTGVGAAAQSLLLASTEVVCRTGDVEDLARDLGVTRRTASRWFSRAKLPPPRRVLAWMRVLLAAEYLDDPRRRIAQIAHVIGYASDNNLRTALNTFLGRAPGALREAGAVRVALPAFWEEIAQARDKPRAGNRL